MPRVNATPLTDEQAARAAGSVAFAFVVVDEHRRLWRHALDRDHAASAALYGLVLAARSFDPARGHWPTHAARWIKGEVSDEADRWRRRGFTSRNGGHGGPGEGPPTPAEHDADSLPGRECGPAFLAELRDEGIFPWH